MNTPATAFLFIGIIVLALAVIAMAIWVASLSGRIRRLSDRLMYDATAQPAPRPSVHGARPSPAATGSYAAQPASGAQGLQGGASGQGMLGALGTPDGLGAQGALGISGGLDGLGAQGGLPDQSGQIASGSQVAAAASSTMPQAVSQGVLQDVSPIVSPGAQAASPVASQAAVQPTGAVAPYSTGAQTVRSIQPAVARVRTNLVQPMEEPDDGQAFFDSYREQSEGQQHTTGAFGRVRPSIPFGEDRNAASRRDVYTEDAVSGDFDPDSIDFSRVAGYKNLRRP